MEWNTLLPYLVSLATIIISALVSYIVAYRTRHVEYEFDYKKYIVKKRTAAYESLEPVLASLNLHKTITRDEKSVGVAHYIFISETDSLDEMKEFLHKYSNAFSNNMWFSLELYNRAKELLNFLLDTARDKTEPATRLAMENLGIEVYDQLEQLRSKLAQRYFEDLQELNNIEKFKKNSAWSK